MTQQSVGPPVNRAPSPILRPLQTGDPILPPGTTVVENSFIQLNTLGHRPETRTERKFFTERLVTVCFPPPVRAWQAPLTNPIMLGKVALKEFLTAPGRPTSGVVKFSDDLFGVVLNVVPLPATIITTGPVPFRVTRPLRTRVACFSLSYVPLLLFTLRSRQKMGQCPLSALHLVGAQIARWWLTFSAGSPHYIPDIALRGIPPIPQRLTCLLLLTTNIPAMSVML